MALLLRQGTAGLLSPFAPRSRGQEAPLRGARPRGPPTRRDPRDLPTASPLLGTAPARSCPREAHGDVATGLVGEGRGVLRPPARRSATLRGWRRSASLLTVESRETPNIA